MPGRLNLAKIATSLTGLVIGSAALLLPITSLPLLSHLAGGTMVAPPSVVLGGIALALCLPAMLIKRQLLPREFIPLTAFAAAALVSSLLSFFLSIPPYKQASPISETTQALLTLIIGLACYTAISLWHIHETRFSQFFRLVNVGGAVMLLWSLAQLYVMSFLGGQYPGWMSTVNNALSLNQLSTFSYLHRVHGFAFEPSWLAHQLNVFYLPYWLASTLTGYTAYGKRFLHISLENILLAIGVVVLLSSLSRIGLVTLLVLAAYLIFSFTKFIVRQSVKRFKGTRLASLVIGMGFVLLYILLAVGLVYGMSFVDSRLAAFLHVEKIPSNWFALASLFQLGERVTYWTIGLQTFGQYPLFGVGLGNSGFFFSQFMPSAARILPEILRIETQIPSVPNIKNLWLRLLGETGLVGFGLYAAWIYTIWRTTIFLRQIPSRLMRAMGWMGIIAIIAYLADGINIDSFALPYIWVALGLVTAASMLVRRDASLANCSDKVTQQPGP